MNLSSITLENTGLEEKIGRRDPLRNNSPATHHLDSMYVELSATLFRLSGIVNKLGHDKVDESERLKTLNEVMTNTHRLLELTRLIAEQERNLVICQPQVNVELNTSVPPVQNPDEVFLSKVLTIIDANLDNRKYSMGNLAKDIGVSYSVLYRRMNALTGKPINVVMRIARLQRAKELLLKKQFKICEVSMLVGFSSPKHFSNSFRAAFGISPREFSKCHHEDDQGCNPTEC